MKKIYKLTIRDVFIGGWDCDDELEPNEYYFTTKKKMVDYVKEDLYDCYGEDCKELREDLKDFRDGLYLVYNDNIEFTGKECRVIG
jgi:hypothetical protein